jgi:hypothetical protein
MSSAFRDGDGLLTFLESAGSDESDANGDAPALGTTGPTPMRKPRTRKTANPDPR